MTCIEDPECCEAERHAISALDSIPHSCHDNPEEMMMSTATIPSYTQEIARATPACFLFVLDQSFSMTEPLAGSGPRKCDALADAINAWLNNMIIKASGSEGI